jgi:hypothetical protein
VAGPARRQQPASLSQRRYRLSEDSQHVHTNTKMSTTIDGGSRKNRSSLARLHLCLRLADVSTRMRHASSSSTASALRPPHMLL